MRLLQKRKELVVLVLALLCTAMRVHAQQQTDESQPASSSSQPADATPSDAPTPTSDPGDTGTQGDRIFGVVPNYTTVEGAKRIEPITNRQAFKMAALDSFDPFVYPLFGVIAAVSHLQNQEPSWGRGASGYSKRFGAAFADNTMCSLITTGLMPTLLRQDPRYFQKGSGGFPQRVGYAASRSLVTHSRAGRREINFSEIVGTAMVASIATAYYPAEERTVSDTLVRWGMQAMWDSVANELKEFWPDIRRRIRKS